MEATPPNPNLKYNESTPLGVDCVLYSAHIRGLRCAKTLAYCSTHLSRIRFMVTLGDTSSLCCVAVHDDVFHIAWNTSASAVLL